MNIINLLLLVLPSISLGEEFASFNTIDSTLIGNERLSRRISRFKAKHGSVLTSLSVNTTKFSKDYQMLLSSKGAVGVQFEALNLRDYLILSSNSNDGYNNDDNDGNDSDDVVSMTSATLAIGVISALGNTGHRNAIRETWLRISRNNLLPYDTINDSDTAFKKKFVVVHKFFVALPPSSDISEIPLTTLLEAWLYNDIALLPFRDSYSETPKKAVALFKWGRSLSAAYVLRANDDVYLELDGILDRLENIVPVKVYGGLIIDGSTMRIPRPTHHGLNDTVESQQTLLRRHRAWTFTTSSWPSDGVPTFAQGNAVILSNDLAGNVADLSEKPWRQLSYVADDVLIGLVVHGRVGGGHAQMLHIDAGYEHEGRWVDCRDEVEWIFNVHPEFFYMFWGNKIRGRGKCEGVQTRLCCGIQ